MEIGENIGIKLSREIYEKIAKPNKRYLIDNIKYNWRVVWSETWSTITAIINPTNRLINIEILKKIPLTIVITPRVYIQKPF
jgi:hypothetical protein